MPKAIPFHFCIALAALAAIIVVSIGIAKPRGFDPDAACVGNQRVIAAALSQYVQDDDEKYPDMQTAQVFDSAVSSYTAGYSSKVFICPATGVAYVPNPSLSYQYLATINNTFTTATIKDAVPHPDGLVTVAFVDQHIEQNRVVQGDPNVQGLYNAKQLALGLAQYVEDYDERFPPMQTQPAFEAALIPYVDDPYFFSDAANGRPFNPNPSLSYARLQDIPHPATTVTFRGGSGIIGYVDSRVVQKGITPPVNTADASRQDLLQLSLGCMQYEEDYNDNFPPLDSNAAFERAVNPYVRNRMLFTEPGTDLPYLLNSSLNGENINDVPSPSTTALLQDPVINQQGILNIAYVDGHVQSDYYYLPTSLTIALSGQPSLVYSMANGSGSIGEINAYGHIVHKTDYTSDLPPGGALTEVATLDSAQRVLLWSGMNGLVNVQTTDAGGAFASQSISGPYDGWQSIGVATYRGATRILWKRYDGEVALWTVSHSGKYVSSMMLDPPSYETPIAVAVAYGGLAYVLFGETDGSADVWTISSSGSVENEQHYGTSMPMQTITGFTVGADQLVRLLFDDRNGNAEIQPLDNLGDPASPLFVHQSGNPVPEQIVVSGDGDLFLLWKNQLTSEGVVVDKLQPNGKRIYTRRFKPYM